MEYTDTELLDFLQDQLDKNSYSGRCIFRWSLHKRGWRLHETTMPEAVSNVRQAISNGIDQEKITDPRPEPNPPDEDFKSS